MTALRLIDIVLVAFSAPVLVLLGAPALGILAGGTVWILQRVAELRLARYAATREDIKNVIGLNLAGVFARAWLVAITILAVGLAGEREDEPQNEFKLDTWIDEFKPQNESALVRHSSTRRSSTSSSRDPDDRRWSTSPSACRRSRTASRRSSRWPTT
jgi:hypothetical protein